MEYILAFILVLSLETWAEISTFAIYSAILSAAMMSSLLLTRRNYPEAGPRDSFGLRNQRMNAPEDRGLFPLLLVLGQLGRTDARQASAASRWKHHLTKWQCTESDGLQKRVPILQEMVRFRGPQYRLSGRRLMFHCYV